MNTRYCHKCKKETEVKEQYGTYPGSKHCNGFLNARFKKCACCNTILAVTSENEHYIQLSEIKTGHPALGREIILDSLMVQYV